MNQEVLQQLTIQQLETYRNTLHRRIDDLKLFNLEIGRDNMRLAQEYRIMRDLATTPTRPLRNFEFDDLYKISKNKISSWIPWGGSSIKKQNQVLPKQKLTENHVSTSNQQNKTNSSSNVKDGNKTSNRKNFQFDDLPGMGWRKLKSIVGFGKLKENKKEVQSIQEGRQKQSKYQKNQNYQNYDTNLQGDHQYEIEYSSAQNRDQYSKNMNEPNYNYKPLYHPGMENQQDEQIKRQKHQKIQNRNENQNGTIPRQRQKIFNTNYNYQHSLQGRYQKIDSHINQLRRQVDDSNQKQQANKNLHKQERRAGSGLQKEHQNLQKTKNINKNNENKKQNNEQTEKQKLSQEKNEQNTQQQGQQIKKHRQSQQMKGQS